MVITLFSNGSAQGNLDHRFEMENGDVVELSYTVTWSRLGETPFTLTADPEITLTKADGSVVKEKPVQVT